MGGEGFPKVMQDGRDGDEEPGYIGNIRNSATMGFKYFDCRGVREFGIVVRGYCDGVFEVRTAWDGAVLAAIRVRNSNVWEEYKAPCEIPDGVQAIYLTYKGGGNPSLRTFMLL